MANKSLTDLAARTATADSDLIHVNSGGTDYKEQKIDFLEGALYHKFNTSSLLTSQIDALPLEKTFFGMINSYGHTSETGVPLNASFFVTVYNTDNNGYRYAEITSVGGGVVYTNTKNGTSWVGWTAVPTRAEITSLNNSLTKCLTTDVIRIQSGDDLNNYKNNGLFIVQNGVANAPQEWCGLLVIGGSGAGSHQMSFTNNAVYVRSYTGTPLAWTAWRKLTPATI